MIVLEVQTGSNIIIHYYRKNGLWKYKNSLVLIIYHFRLIEYVENAICLSCFSMKPNSIWFAVYLTVQSVKPNENLFHPVLGSILNNPLLLLVNLRYR